MFVKKKYEAKKARKSKVDWYNLAYWVSKANEPEYGDMSITLKEIADYAHTTVDDVKAHAYDIMRTMRGIDCIEDVYWRGDADSPITFTKKKMWYEGRRANEASALIRGGKPTKLFAVINTIASLGNKARSSDLTAHFVQPMGFYSMFQSTPGIIKDTSGGRPFYSVTDDLYKQYVDACKQLGKRPWSLDGTKQGSSPASPAPAKSAAPATGTVMPFEQCFFASMILDAKDYSGGRECSWIDPKNLNHVLATYEDDEGTPLSRKMSDLRQKYDLLKEKCLADGKSKVARVGEDYGTIDSESIPGIEDYLEMWPKHSPDGRVQQATSLWMCVAPSRDKVKFDSNEWNSRPVIDV